MSRPTRSSRTNGVQPTSNVRSATGRFRSTGRARVSYDDRSNGVEIIDDEQYDDTVWEVEKVMGKKYDQDGRSFYHLKWKSYDGEPTWEPKENCHCKDLIDAYEEIIANRERDPSRDEPLPGPSHAATPAKTKSTPRRSNRL